MISSTLVTCWTGKSRLLAFEDTADVNPGLTVHLRKIAAVAHQPPGRCERAQLKDRRDRMADRERREMFGLADEKSVGGDHETCGLQIYQPGEDSIEIAISTGVENLELEPQRASRCLEFAGLDLGDGMHPIDECADGCRRRDQSLQQFQPLRLQLNAHRGHTGEIGTRSIQASDKPECDRINAGDEDDRNGRGRSFGREHSKDVTGLGDYGDLLMDQIGRQRRQPMVLLLRPAILDGDIPTFDKAGFAQALAKGAHPTRVQVGGRTAQVPDHRHRSLLRARRQRPPRRRAAKQRDEFAPPAHSITSSATASTFAGTSRPSALAATTLMTSSYLVGISTGKSPGFVPLRMDAT